MGSILGFERISPDFVKIIVAPSRDGFFEAKLTNKEFQILKEMANNFEKGEI